MKALLKFSLIFLCFSFAHFVSQAADNLPIKYGLNLYYVHGFCDINNRIKAFPEQSSLSVFKDEAMSGFGFGISFNTNLSENEFTGHSLELRSNYEMFDNKNFKKTFNAKYILVSGLGDTVDFIVPGNEHTQLKLSYFDLDLIYCFSFLDNHIGIEIGPSLSFLMGNEISSSLRFKNPFTHKNETKVMIDKQEINNVEDFNFTIHLGLNFPINMENYELVPFVSFKPRTVYDKNSGNAPLIFKTNNLSAGIIIRSL